jgi:GT2 family glycosyltransferase
LEGLLQSVESDEAPGVVGGRVLDPNGFIAHIGVAFDANQTYFHLPDVARRLCRRTKEREFKALEGPFVIARELLCRLGGFSADLMNRFEDIDFCLRVQQEGRRVLYTPSSTIIRAEPSWLPDPDQDRLNCYRFYARWTGSLWQDDDRYLKEDGLTHEDLSALYRDLVNRLSGRAGEQGAVAAAGAA